MSLTGIGRGLGLGVGTSATSSGAPDEGFSTWSAVFDGLYAEAGDYLRMDSKITLAGAFSISVWLKPTRNNNNILGDSTTTANYLYMDNSAILKMKGGFAVQTFTNCTISTGVWTHIAITRDGSGNLKCYKNGSRTDTNIGVTAAFPFDQVSNYDNLDNTFEGNIDELATFTSALSASDVSDIYGAGVAAFSPAGWWRMGENNSPSAGVGLSTVTDMVGGNDATQATGVLQPLASRDVP